MAREKEGCREVFAELFAQYGVATVRKQEAAKILGVSMPTMTRLVSSGKISATGKFVSLWNLAKFLVS